jgi:hypothetical protein
VDAAGAKACGSSTGFIWDVMTIDHPLDGPVTTKHKQISYAGDYFQTSSFVHCALPAIDNHAVDEATPFQVSISSGHNETSQSTLFIVFLYLHSTIVYALFGMNLDRPPKLDALFQNGRTLRFFLKRRRTRFSRSVTTGYRLQQIQQAGVNRGSHAGTEFSLNMRSESPRKCRGSPWKFLKRVFCFVANGMPSA